MFDDLGEDQAGQEEIDGGGGETADLVLCDQAPPGHEDGDQNDQKDDRDCRKRTRERGGEGLDHWG